MKKTFKTLLSSMLTATALVPAAVSISACSKNGTETETVITRKFSFINDYNDTARAQIGAAAYTVSTTEFVVGQENKITITFDKNSELIKVTSLKQNFEIFQTNPFGRTPGELVEGTDYTVENPSTHVYVIKFTAAQSNKITKNMTVRFKACYKSVRVKVTLPGTDKLSKSLDDWWTYNSYVNSDFSFLAVPRHLEAGYDVSENVIKDAKIWGVDQAGAEHHITNIKIEKVLAYFKMQSTGEPYASNSHYMKITIPMSELFNVDANENFTAKYKEIKLVGDTGCSPHTDTQFANKFIINAKNCSLVSGSRDYAWKTWKNPTTGEDESGLVFTETFAADSGKTFKIDYSSKNELPISSLRIQSKNELFKTIKIDNLDDLKNDFFVTTEAGEFDYFINQLVDRVPKLQNWLTFIPSENNTKLTVIINVRKMCKYTQMPTLSSIRNDKLESYSGGCVDFLDYLSMELAAE